MARRTQVVLEDDIDGGQADQTVAFAIDRVAYEIDLSDNHAAQLREALQPWIAHARQSVAARPPRPRRSARTDAAQLAAQRDWARANGHTVSDRGRVPRHVAEAYERAHRQQP